MTWPGAMLTDSGGYQVFSLSELRQITEAGVTFQSHLNGATHRFTPASTVDVQLALGSDIMMVLDECPPYPVSHEFARASMERTVRWAKEAMEHYREQNRGFIPRGKRFSRSCRAHFSRIFGASAPSDWLNWMLTATP